MDVQIRRATVNDAQGIVDVINSVIQEGGLTAIYPTLTVQEEEAYIQGLDERSAIFVAEISGAILGLQSIDPFDPYTQAMNHVATMGTWVYRNFRGRGVGTQLFAETLRFSRKRGYEKFVIYVRAGNRDAQDFYRKMGFVPKFLLERQIKIGSRYDDEVLMEMFLPAAPPTEAAETAPTTEPAPRAEPAQTPVFVAAPEPAPATQPLPQPRREVDPIVGAVTVRRAKRRDVRTLAAIMKGTMRWQAPPSEDEVLEMLFDKGYWLAMSRKGGGLSGWRAENLVMCIDDFYVYPPQYHPQVGGPLLETIETEAKALSCEVAIIFVDERIAPQAVAFFESQGYERQEMEELYSIWREVAQEFVTEKRFMMVKKLRDRRIMRPL